MYSQFMSVAVGGLIGAGVGYVTSKEMGFAAGSLATAAFVSGSNKIKRSLANRIAPYIRDAIENVEVSNDTKGRAVNAAINHLKSKNINDLTYQVLNRLDNGEELGPVELGIGNLVADQVMEKKFNGRVPVCLQSPLRSLIVRVVGAAATEIGVLETVTSVATNLLGIKLI